MNILGVNVPNVTNGNGEICHELTIRYSLAKLGKDTTFELDSDSFERHLKGCKKIDKEVGVIATFWDRGHLFHSMIVGVDDRHWIGSNNVNSFGIAGDRVSLDVSGQLLGTDKIQLRGANPGTYDIEYYSPEDVASYVPEVDPEPGCCC